MSVERKPRPKSEMGIINRVSSRKQIEQEKVKPLDRNILLSVVDGYRNSIRYAETARKMLVQLAEKAKTEKDKLQTSESSIEQKPTGTSLKIKEACRYWMQQLALAQYTMGEMRKKHGKSLELAHRDYIREWLKFIHFEETFDELIKVERMINDFQPELSGFTPKTHADRRNQAIAGEMVTYYEPWSKEDFTRYVPKTDKEAKQLSGEGFNILDLLKIMPDEETKRLLEEIIQEDISSEGKTVEKDNYDVNNFPVLSELQDRHEKLLLEAQEQWESSMVRKFWHEKKDRQMIQAVYRGDKVLETDSVINYRKQLGDIRRKYKDTTIGAVLVGEPGVGKTTLVEYDAEKRDRNCVYIDMSEHVTRYTLFGSPEMAFETQLDFLKRFSSEVGTMSEENLMGTLKKMISERAQKINEEMPGLSSEEREALAASQLDEELRGGRVETPTEPTDAEAAKMAQFAGISVEEIKKIWAQQSAENTKTEEEIEKMQEKIAPIRKALTKLVDENYQSEAAKKLLNLTKKNGWRDGIVIHALRNNLDLIIDEFNVQSQWTLMHRLLTSRPGEDYYFADNKEHIHIPKEWRMYFTGNVGTKHGTYEVKEALASRVGGKVIEVTPPPLQEEMEVMMVMLSNQNERIIRSEEDISKIMFLFKEIVSKVRQLIKDKQSVIPMSYRILRDLRAELIDSEWQIPRSTTVDQAIFNVFIKPYALFRDRSLAKQIAEHCMAAGLLLGEEVEKEVMEWSGISKDELTQKRKDQKPRNWKEIMKEIRDQAVSAATAQLPITPAV